MKRCILGEERKIDLIEEENMRSGAVHTSIMRYRALRADRIIKSVLPFWVSRTIS